MRAALYRWVDDKNAFILRVLLPSHVKESMQDKDFGHLIRRMRDIPQPKCPADVESNVLRRVRLAAAPPAPSLYDWLLGIVPKPSFVLPVMALTLLVNLASTMMSANLHGDSTQKPIIASKALGFDVFQSKTILNLEAN